MNREEFHSVLEKINEVLEDTELSCWEQEGVSEQIELIMRKGFQLPDTDEWSW